ncbi:MAG: hypothetical protein J2P46_13140, partial [Zavarzinella sp.]|nr:hypothetical protein [Zavarzinella sp.]
MATDTARPGQGGREAAEPVTTAAPADRDGRVLVLMPTANDAVRTLTAALDGAGLACVTCPDLA